ncbi:LiaF domain-containing protein [Actinoplanes sp. NPDC026619]|uniref:LiaF domain-containing protein n=1 Tax=Actinoplanes sp. NPDC026619 TaxID=3155798 RepID=UPI0033CE03C2
MDANEERPFLTGRSGATWYVTVLGGLKRRGPWRVPRDMRTISILGGANLDLCEAELPEGAVLTKISLIGGVSLKVPNDVDVEVEGFRIFGGVRIEEAPRSGGPVRTLKVRDYSLVGGVHVERC